MRVRHTPNPDSFCHSLHCATQLEPFTTCKANQCITNISFFFVILFIALILLIPVYITQSCLYNSKKCSLIAQKIIKYNAMLRPHSSCRVTEFALATGAMCKHFSRNIFCSIFFPCNQRFVHVYMQCFKSTVWGFLNYYKNIITIEDCKSHHESNLMVKKYVMVMVMNLYSATVTKSLMH